MNALTTIIVIASTVCFIAWSASIITRDHSWVDRIWSIVPAVYLIVVAIHGGAGNHRTLVMAVLGTLWGARLTFNFARRGGYTGLEDYRWEILRQSMSKWQFQLFNIFFIVLYQNFILVIITLPAIEALKHNKHFGAWDFFFTVGFLLLLAGETIADQQQWNFQSKKYADIAAGKKPVSNFCTTGLFKFSRHPNYFFEQAQWWVIYFLGAYAEDKVFNIYILGAALLTLLFVGSTSFTEKISLSKYPEYAEYQRTTSAVIPFFKKSGSR